MLSIGIDVGGTKVAYGLFDEAGTLLDRRQHAAPMLADGPELSALLLENIRGMMAENGIAEADLQGIGIGMPSFIIFDKGYIYMTSAMVNVRDFPMLDWFRQRIRVPVAIDKDSNLSAVAEHRFGAGRGHENMVYTTLGTGIGSGLILNNRLFHGSYGWAGETGHMLITPDQGVECGCRNRGCFMSYASGRYIPEQLRRFASGRQTALDLNGALDGYALKQALDAGDGVAREFVQQAAHYIGVCCFNVYLMLNINLFVFGGGLVNLGAPLLDGIRATFDRYNHVDMPVEFRLAELKQDFGIIGAAELVRQTFPA